MLELTMSRILTCMICFLAFSNDASAQSDGVTIELAILKPDLVIAEPLMIRLTVTNHGDDIVRAPARLSPRTSSAEYLLAKEGDAATPIAAPSIRDPVVWHELGRGDSFVHEESFVVHWSTVERRPLLHEPGVYALNVRTWIQGIAIESGPVTFTVRNPTDQPTIDLLDAGITTEVLSVLEDGVAPAGMLPLLEPLAKGESRFAPYAAIAVARGYIRGNDFGLPVEDALKAREARAVEAARFAIGVDRDGEHLQAAALEIFAQACAILDLRSLEAAATRRLLELHPDSAAAARVR